MVRNGRRAALMTLVVLVGIAAATFGMAWEQVGFVEAATSTSTNSSGPSPDKLAIMELAARFEKAFDNGDIDAHMSTWANTMQFESPFGNFDNREAYRAWVTQFAEIAAQSGGTRHVMLNHEIKVTGNTAEMHAYLFIYSRRPTPTLNFTTVVTDRFRKINGQWKFTYRKLEIDQELQNNPTPTPTSQFVPVPEAARIPAIPEKGYLVQELRDGLYMVTNGIYQMIFVVTDTGVIAVDAPPILGTNILKAIAEVTDKPITHVVYSHAHADHAAGVGIYPADAVYIAQEETAALIERANNPPLPKPTVTFKDKYTLEVGGQVLELAYYGNNHQPGETFVYAPKQKVLMHVDIIFPGWAPFKNLAIAQDIPGFIEAFDETLAYDFDIFVGGHLGRTGTRADVELQRQYILDLKAAAIEANKSVDYLSSIQGVDPHNVWAQFDAYADAVTNRCMELMPKRYLTELGGADVFLEDNCFVMTESLRIDMVQ